MFRMLVNAIFSNNAVVIHMDAAIPETTQLAWLCESMSLGYVVL